MKKAFKTWLASSTAVIATIAMAFSGILPAMAQEVPMVVLPATLTINKVAVGGNGTFDFTGSNGFPSFSITTIDGNGNYVYPIVESNFFTITEGELPDGWEQTGNTCNGNDGGISVVLGQDASCTITNTYTPPLPTYSISGTVYHDNNSQNGQFDEGEDGLNGWTVYLDDNNNNEFDEELSDVTEGNGQYEFTGLVAGCYTVREVLQNNWNQTEPTEVDDFEYQVSVGGSTFCNAPSLVSFVRDLFIKTANAAVVLNAYNLDFGNVEQPRSGGSSGSRRKDDSSTTTNDDPGQVLGDTTTTPSVPLVLGATLPVTGGNPTAILLMIALLAAPMYYFRSLAVKKN